MTKKDERPAYPLGSDRPPFRVRLPGFIRDEEIGLGDAVKRTTSYLGMKTCASCGRRAEALNRWLVFTNRAQSR
jgi:hypothetical protein